MSEALHTPESEWEVIESEYYCTIRIGKAYMQAPYQPPHGRGHCRRQIADAHRIVNSVKACKDMADPAAEITRLRAELAEAREAVRVLANEARGWRDWSPIGYRGSEINRDKTNANPIAAAAVKVAFSRLVMKRAGVKP